MKWICVYSLPPGLQARCVQSSSHPVIESWRFQDCKFLTSNHRVIQSLWGCQACKVLIGARLPSNPVVIPCHRPPNFLPQNTPKSIKSMQIHLKSIEINEIHRKSSQGHQIPQESMKSTQIHQKSMKIDASNHRVIQSSNLGGSKIASLRVCRPPGSVIRMEVPRLQSSNINF